MENMKRSVTCADLTGKEIGQTVTLNGWVHRNRNHGGIHFIDLRDRYGITQIVVGPDAGQELTDVTAELKFEYCVAVEGTVRKRPDNMVNKDMPTGDIEVSASAIEVLSRCDTLPFMIDERSDAREDLRLEYRFLDLRSASMQRKIRLRHNVAFAVREYLNSRQFLEIETPTLIRSTPEGARDFLVPSRLHPGKFYALPQSPQLFKQILMVSGFDKYFQIARCFRDEDARGDRQLEHTQIDIEMSFVSKDDVFDVVEGMMSHIFSSAIDKKLATPFERMSYDDAMNKFGSDKPDLRFAMEFVNFEQFVPASDFNVFKEVIKSGGSVRALVAPGCAEYSRKMIEDLEGTAKTYGAKGLAWMKMTDAGLEGGVSRFFASQSEGIVKTLSAKPGDLVLIVADKWKTCCTSLGAVRSRLGKDLDLLTDEFRFCWIVDFPLFDWNADSEKWEPAHHMFTMPQEQYLDTLEDNPGEVKGDLYDLVCNGLELASGSIRIHTRKLQQRVFSILGISPDEAEQRFGFLLKAFRFGPPPHGGIAPGLDRLIMILTGETSIKDVIAFPKNTVGVSPMDESPSVVDSEQLEELFLRLVEPGAQS
ncbi:MAG: aspartate--tRNA ligase [Spirochaetales bacterium]|nr:aspartate--tRNA ligase [Spirochaetales bacterium]